MVFQVKNQDINDVYGAIWLATAILTYQRFLNLRNTQQEFTESTFAFKQIEIQCLASKLCTNKIHNARISQWCNADHLNNTYNYLRAVGNLRRITIPGECNNELELPENLLPQDTIIIEILDMEIILTYSDIIKWVKENYPKLINMRMCRKEASLRVVPSLSRRIKKVNLSIPDANTSLKKFAIGIDFSKLVVETSLWVSKDIFDFITENSKLRTPGVFYPYAVRKQGAELEGKKPRWKETKNGRLFIDSNHKPQNALSYCLTGKSFQAAFKDKNYACCHIYGNKYIHEWKYFTCIGNLIFLPSALQSLTDHDEDVMNCLSQIAYLRFGWKPEGFNLNINDKVKDLIPLVKEIKCPLEIFSNVWERELSKYRLTYKEAFNTEPEF